MSACRGISSGSRITKSMLKDPDAVPDIPVYTPTWEEFCDFSHCVSLIESMGAHHIGLCKVIPPENWVARPEGYANIEDFVVERPICQVTHGARGIFFQEMVPKKSMSFREFRDLACSNAHVTPNHSDIDQLERKYWASIGFGRPIYGANVAGSMTTKKQNVWNIARLDSMLSRVLNSEGVTIPGVNTPYLYYGMWRSTFAWHVEDVDLYSINYVHFGAPKHWYVIPPAYARRFEAFVFEYFRADFLNCHCFLRHKCVLIHPKVLKRAGIPTRKIVQHAGEFMLTFPYAYHSGFNMGLNVAESTNFALPRWIEYGKKAKLCHCWDDTVKICMDPFVRLYQPHLYDDWIKGIDRVAHPLDEYEKDTVIKVTPSSKGSLVKGQFASLMHAPDTIPIVQSSSRSPRVGFTIGDLNLLDVRYITTDLIRAKIPYHLTKSRFTSLWSASPADLSDERRFNCLIGSYEPHCAVCALLWSPQHFGKVINSSPSMCPLPKASTPYIPEIAYNNSNRLPVNLSLSSEANSTILRCSRCCLTVHARCYGVTVPSAGARARDASPIRKGAQSRTTFWHCDACIAPRKPSCLLCYMRGGAMKQLANPVHKHTGRPYWAHISCALANPGCQFVDIPRRLAAISSEAIERAYRDSCLRAKRSRMLSNEWPESDESTDPLDPGSRHPQVGSPTTETVGDWSTDSTDMVTQRAGTKQPQSNILDALLSGVAITELFPEVAGTTTSVSSRRQTLHRILDIDEKGRVARTSSTRQLGKTPATKRKRGRSRTCPDELVRQTVTVSSGPSRCVVCRLPSRGFLPMAACWHSECELHYHLTCAQMAGVMIGTDTYPNMLYLACDKHPTSSLTTNSIDTEMCTGRKIVVRKPGNPPTFVQATVVRLVTPIYCRVAFSDGTFSRDTPPEYLTDVDWTNHGPPAPGSVVKVLWKDGVEYAATFQGTTLSTWEVFYSNRKTEVLARDQFYVVGGDQMASRTHRAQPWEVPVCFEEDDDDEDLSSSPVNDVRV